MVFYSQKDTDTVFTPSQFQDWATESFSDFAYDELVENSWGLRALANDRDFLLASYHRELDQLDREISGNILSPQSVTIIRSPSFFVRANIWLPKLEDRLHQKSEQTLYAYELPHDHNFHFATVGYFGQGYHTDLFKYDVGKVVGYIGEKVDVEACGSRTLGPGDTMVYKANEDIHIQYEPNSLSVSLNFIPINEHIFTSPQFVFDPNEKTICAGVSDQVASRLFLLDFFRHVYNDETVKILDDVMTKHQCPRTRGMALSVLREISPSDEDFFLRKASPNILQFSRSDLVSAGYSRLREG